MKRNFEGMDNWKMMEKIDGIDNWKIDGNLRWGAIGR